MENRWAANCDSTTKLPHFHAHGTTSYCCHHLERLYDTSCFTVQIQWQNKPSLIYN